MPDGRRRRQAAHPISADALKPVVETLQAAGKPFNMGMVFPVSTHNYELRYWLAAGGMHPGLYSAADTSGQIGAEVMLSVTPPPQMPATLEAGTIDGYCVGEPWNQAAVFKGIGVPVIADIEIWKNKPEKVFGLTADFAKKNPNTSPPCDHEGADPGRAVARCGQEANRAEAVTILAKPHYVGADEAVIANSMTGTFEFEKGDKRAVPDFNVFFRYFATYPFYSDAIWFLTQMRRWGQIAATSPTTMVCRDCQVGLSARPLRDRGKACSSTTASSTPRRHSVRRRRLQAGQSPISSMASPTTASKPGAYVDSLKIGLKEAQTVSATPTSRLSAAPGGACVAPFATTIED